MERELIAERTKAGLAAARQRGRPSRTKTADAAQQGAIDSATAPEWRVLRKVARNPRVSISTPYRWIPDSTR